MPLPSSLGCSDKEMPWGKTSPNELENKYLYVCHAEMNAILNKNSADVEQCSIYVALFPCNECAKMIIQSGIKEVIYLSDKNSAQVGTVASKRLLETAGVAVRRFVPTQREIVIRFPAVDDIPSSSSAAKS